MADPRSVFALLLLCYGGSLAAHNSTGDNSTGDNNTGRFRWHMDEVIRVVQQAELSHPHLDALHMAQALRAAAGHDHAFLHHLLGVPGHAERPTSAPGPLPPGHRHGSFVSGMFLHRVTGGGAEEGVVLTPDGTTVALAPLLLGIEAGLLEHMGSEGTPEPQSINKSFNHSQFPHLPRALYSVTLAQTLGLSFLGFHSSQLPRRLGPDGCWDNVMSPAVFLLSGAPSLATTALLNGGMDGLILGERLYRGGADAPRLSVLLREYYYPPRHAPEEGAGPGAGSSRRRQNFLRLVDPPRLQREVLAALSLQAALGGGQEVGGRGGLLGPTELAVLVEEGLKEFFQEYVECPAIIPRCMWGAEPYRGTPTLLTLPLGFLYVHHTYEPSAPCLSFEHCARDMRGMQRFHQDDRGWDDIGYSFVVGSDGYVYEGRGWLWRGAHTKGHNSLGYGVSIIGDYSTALPSPHTLALLRDSLAQCAVRGGRLVDNYTIHGHRQVVDTSCPGDALYSEIRGWQHYQEVEPKPQTGGQTAP
ncbi:N-acetylmuramoyl-L-alanine amidase [Amia ocellicauda]|uniref:N-acetylmuramoyl-L-alanine amidase n=1 Tax=Amia ocellicauda TaxID=2972642 RepID=UPI0034647ED4